MTPARKKQKLANGDASNSATLTEDTDRPRKDNAEQQQNRRSLFVRGIPTTATTASLTELFSDAFPVKHATAVIDPATKLCKGYGFVTFADAEDAAGAKREFEGREVEGGKRLRIEVAEPRQRDGEGGKEGVGGGERKGKMGKEGSAVSGNGVVQPSRLIVRNLPWTIKTSEQLERLFLSYGKVKQAYIPKKGGGRGAGFGFVVLRGRKNAEKALEGVNGREIDGRTVAVDWAVEKGVYEKAMNGMGEGEENGDQVGGEAEEGEGNQGDEEDKEIGDDELDSAEGEEDEDEDDVEVRVDGEPENDDRPDERASTLFVRNLPFTCADEDLEDHFSQFGSTRYARVVMDFDTGRSKGTGFVCFYRQEDCDACLRAAPRRQINTTSTEEVKQAPRMHNSILQNEDTDPSGQYTMDGRVLQVSRAVDKSEANRLTDEGAAHRHKRNEDKRRLFLLSEGTIPSNSKLYESLPPSERTMREASAKQRKKLIESNPSLHLSLTRLSVRNIPRSIGSAELKALAREAVVGFATDVKAGTRTKLSKEEVLRGGEAMLEAEKERREKGKGIVKQAKVVFEGASGGKVAEDKSGAGAGRSRGYGFIEYHTHRNALMGLRWLNGHAIGYRVKDPEKAGKNAVSREELQDRKKRLIVEFAIENAQVVMRRRDKESKARERSQAVQSGMIEAGDGVENSGDAAANGTTRKRKRGADDKPARGRGGKKDQLRKAGMSFSKHGLVGPKGGKGGKGEATAAGNVLKKAAVDEKVAKRNQIIGRKRAARKAKRGGK